MNRSTHPPGTPLAGLRTNARQVTDPLKTGGRFDRADRAPIGLGAVATPYRKKARTGVMAVIPEMTRILRRVVLAHRGRVSESWRDTCIHRQIFRPGEKGAW